MRRYLTTSAVAKLAGVDSSTVRLWSNRGKLPTARTADGRVRLFAERDVQRFLAQRHARAPLAAGRAAKTQAVREHRPEDAGRA